MASLFLKESLLYRSRYFYIDTGRRSIVKTLTYRLFGSTATVAIVLAVTGSPGIAASAGMLDCLLKTIFYYVHERAWSHIDYGRLGAGPWEGHTHAADSR
jgi:uncharacterized membrane protein